MERDGCYFITDKKPRRDRLRWEGHTEKVGDSAMWKTDIKSTMEDREE